MPGTAVILCSVNRKTCRGNGRPGARCMRPNKVEGLMQYGNKSNGITSDINWSNTAPVLSNRPSDARSNSGALKTQTNVHISHSTKI